MDTLVRYTTRNGHAIDVTITREKDHVVQRAIQYLNRSAVLMLKDHRWTTYGNHPVRLSRLIHSLVQIYETRVNAIGPDIIGLV